MIYDKLYIFPMCRNVNYLNVTHVLTKQHVNETLTGRISSSRQVSQDYYKFVEKRLMISPI